MHLIVLYKVLYKVRTGSKAKHRQTSIDNTVSLFTKNSENSEKEPNWLYIQRKSQIGCKFRGRAELSVHLEKESICLSIWI